MGNSFFRAYGSHFRAERVVDRLDAGRFVVEVAQVMLHEGDKPDTLARLRHPHILPRTVTARPLWPGAAVEQAPRRAAGATIRPGSTRARGDARVACWSAGSSPSFDPAFDPARCCRNATFYPRPVSFVP